MHLLYITWHSICLFDAIFPYVVIGYVCAGMYQIREANQMIEEFMLAANISVAKKILEHFPFTSLLR